MGIKRARRIRCPEQKLPHDIVYAHSTNAVRSFVSNLASGVVIRAISGKHIGIHPQHCHSFGSLLVSSPCVGEAANGRRLCDCVFERDDASKWMVDGGVSTSTQLSVPLF